MESPGNNRERPSPPDTSPGNPLKSSTITEAFAMGVCSSTEQGIIKRENDFNSDELKKEHLEDKVVGEKPDSSIAATSDG